MHVCVCVCVCICVAAFLRAIQCSGLYVGEVGRRHRRICCGTFGTSGCTGTSRLSESRRYLELASHHFQSMLGRLTCVCEYVCWVQPMLICTRSKVQDVAWGNLNLDNAEAAAEMKRRLEALDAGVHWDAVHASKPSHGVSPALQDLVCVCVCHGLLLMIRVAQGSGCGVRERGRRRAQGAFDCRVLVRCPCLKVTMICVRLMLERLVCTCVCCVRAAFSCS